MPIDHDIGRGQRRFDFQEAAVVKELSQSCAANRPAAAGFANSRWDESRRRISERNRLRFQDRSSFANHDPTVGPQIGEKPRPRERLMAARIERDHLADTEAALPQGPEQFTTAKDMQKHIGNLPIVEKLVARLQVAHHRGPQQDSSAATTVRPDRRGCTTDCERATRTIRPA